MHMAAKEYNLPLKYDLTDQKFGKLTVIDRAKNHRSPCGRLKTMWNCRCECGNIKAISLQSLKNGTRTCGVCYKVSPQYKDLTGQVFGRLLVIKDVGRSKFKVPIWYCKCLCGEEAFINSVSLKSGNTKSCGCYKFGENCALWKGGLTPLKRSIRQLPQYKKWKQLVFKRDKRKCSKCGHYGKIHAHHIVHFSALLKKFNIGCVEDAIKCSALWDVSNGLTLCHDCHILEHPETPVLAFLPQ